MEDAPPAAPWTLAEVQSLLEVVAAASNPSPQSASKAYWLARAADLARSHAPREPEKVRAR